MLGLRIQAAFYEFMGAWPLLSLKSFEAVSGAKVDKWLVKTISWIFVVIGIQLWLADSASEVIAIGLGSALVLSAADIYYSVKRTISFVYLADAAVQLCFVMGWIVYLTR